MKIREWESSGSMRTNGQTHMTKLTVAFRNFADAPQKDSCPLNRCRNVRVPVPHFLLLHSFFSVCPNLIIN
jgi:hypothetical protein